MSKFKVYVVLSKVVIVYLRLNSMPFELAGTIIGGIIMLQLRSIEVELSGERWERQPG